MDFKTCTNKTCQKTKPLDEFPPDKKHADGRGSWCRECGRAACKKWAASHKESIELRRLKNKDHIVAKSKERWIAKKEYISKANREWAARHPEKMAEYSKAWRMRDYEHAKELGRKAAAKRLTTTSGKLNSRMSADIRACLKRGAKGLRHWETLVDFTVDELKRHLEKQFTPEMSWDNHGTYWHIDHKIPKSIFNFESPEDIDFKKCWSLKNIQPLKAKENRVKSAKIDKPFQPSLAIAI